MLFRSHSLLFLPFPRFLHYQFPPPIVYVPDIFRQPFLSALKTAAFKMQDLDISYHIVERKKMFFLQSFLNLSLKRACFNNAFCQICFTICVRRHLTKLIFRIMKKLDIPLCFFYNLFIFLYKFHNSPANILMTATSRLYIFQRNICLFPLLRKPSHFRLFARTLYLRLHPARSARHCMHAVK